MSDLLFGLGEAMLLTQPELMKLVRSAPRRYKVYQIPKRTPGTLRTIAQPAKEVKALQYWVMRNVLQQFPVHHSATGYRVGRNIADNARPHASGRFLLKLDFANFFPSLKARDFAALVHRSNVHFETGDVPALSRILFWKPKGSGELSLSIGAPSSPLLSNVLLWEFDSEVERFCLSRNVAYTRYADDMSFSADASLKLQEVEHWIQVLCERISSPTLTLNREKTVRVSKRDARRVTGLVISNDGKVSLGRNQKRLISAMVHHFVAGKLPAEEFPRLKGMLAYSYSVEPTFVACLRRKYGNEAVSRILGGAR